MDYFKINGYKKRFSRIGLGTWAIGGSLWGGTDEQDSITAIQSAIDRDITVIDTAPVYGFGLSEELVGKSIKRHIDRDNVIISTKAGLEWKRNMIFRNSTPDRIRQEVDDSLKRLDTDYIDVYFIHWPDPLVPFEKTAGVMNDLMEKGKIQFIGVSNYNVEQMEAFRKEAPIHFFQPPYNIFEREIEAQELPYCRENNIRLFGYGALCRGMLSGKMTLDREFEGDDIRKHDPKFKEPHFKKYLEAVDKLDELAEDKYGKSVINLAVRWMLDKSIEIALWGARRPSQLDPLDDVFGWNIDEKTFKAIDRIVDETVEPLSPGFMAPGTRKK